MRRNYLGSLSLLLIVACTCAPAGTSWSAEATASTSPADNSGPLPSPSSAAGRVVASGIPLQSKVMLVVGEHPGPLTKLAATELKAYLNQLSGTRVSQASQAENSSLDSQTTLMVLGAAGPGGLVGDMEQAGVMSTAGLKPEGFVVKTVGWHDRPAVVIAGADDAGTLYGAYEFLERLGITFRITGDIVPSQRSTVVIPGLNLRMEPALRRRGFLFAANFDNTSMYSWADYQRMLDQMARMKCNYLQFWWFAYAPWLQYSYRGETKWMGDVSTKESGYHNMAYGGFGSRTIEDVSIGRERFKNHPRMASLEMQHVETPEEAFQVSRDLLRRIIAYAAARNIKVWPVVEMGSLPPNLARHGEIVGEAPFNYVFGTFLHPLDPVNREIQVNRLKALAETYPQAEGFFLNFAELYPELATDKHRDFFEAERPRFQDLRALSAPWSAALASIYDVGVEKLVDSNIGYFDLFQYLLKQRDAVAPGMRLGLMTVGRGYALPQFNKLLPPDVPFASLESSGVWTMLGVPMECFGGMGERERIIQPRIDDDFDMLGMQFSVRLYAEKDRIFADGLKQGLTGVAGQIERARGTEFNSSFLARAAWQPDLTPDQFYREAAERMFGPAAADEMFAAFMKLEANQALLGYYEYDGGYGVLLCCSGIREVNAAYRYWQQRNPYGGPVMRSWKNLMNGSADMIARREASIQMLNEALGHLQAACATVAPRGAYELNYLINRTEVFRDALAGLNTFRRGMVDFDKAFRKRPDTEEKEFVARLQASLVTMRRGHEQLKAATQKYSEIVDHVCDLAVLYHLNARVILGTDLAIQFLQNIADYHAGKPYLTPVHFERLFRPRPDQGAEQ